VYPCSPLSEEEASDLVAAVKPNVLYIDAPPELVDVMTVDVREGRSTACGASGWKIPSSLPGFSNLVGAAGVFSSVPLRNILSDNEMLALLGAESLGPYKAALSSALVFPVPPKVISFPYAMSYRMWETLLRPVDYAAWVGGNSSVGSTAVSVFLGNPHAWTVVSHEGAPPDANVPEVVFTAELPPTGYFTRTQVGSLQREFREAVLRVSEKASIASADMDKDLVDREESARERGDVASAEGFHQRALQAQYCSQAVAFSLKEAAAEVAAAAAAARGSKNDNDAAAPPTLGGVVALVNLGGVGCLQRNWEFSRPPSEALPPFSAFEQSGAAVIPGTICLGLGYGLKRLYKWGKVGKYASLTFGTLLSTGVLTTAYTAVHADWTRYGTGFRAALAAPRTVSSLARMNK